MNEAKLKVLNYIGFIFVSCELSGSEEKISKNLDTERVICVAKLSILIAKWFVHCCVERKIPIHSSLRQVGTELLIQWEISKRHEALEENK